MIRHSAGIALLACAVTAAACGAQPIAVYESEANHAEYHGVYQGPLRTWLTDRGVEFEVIGDGVAADAAQLAEYACVVASSTYIVPDEAAEGIASYVQQGGRAIWLDSPARCGHAGLRRALGLGSGASYTTLREAALSSQQPTHPLCIGGTEISAKQLVGNWAVEVGEGGQTLYEATGTDPQGAEAPLPAVVLSEYGTGKAVVFNWVVWLSREPEVRALIAAGLDYMLADAALSQKEHAAFCSLRRETMRQPEPLQVDCRTYRRSAAQMPPPKFEVQLSDPDGRVSASADEQADAWSHADEQMAVAQCSLSLPTEGLADGAYELTWTVGTGDETWQTEAMQVRLTGDEWRELLRAQRERRKALEPLLVGTLGDYDAEPRTDEGRVDIPRLMEQIETAHMNMYDFLIWHAETDWQDFQEFLPVAREKGIKVWITLCPPSEQGGNWPWSEPYRLDFVKWADEIGKLAEEYDNLVAMVIDDFWSGGNRELFTPAYIRELVQTLRRHNPNVAFLPTIYWPTVGDEEWIGDYGPLIDGIVFPYMEYETGDDLEEQLAGCREWIGPDKFLLVNVYASGSGGQRGVPERTEAYMRKTLTVSREHADGIRIYCLPKGDLLDDHRYRVTAELYGEWEAEGK